MKAIVIIQFNVEGFHQYNDAPEVVSFLSQRHRHTFVVRCGYGVTDLNREREIFLCREEIKQYLCETFGSPCEFEDRSCEAIATEILEYGKKDGMTWCEVWEEETGGARIECQK